MVVAWIRLSREEIERDKIKRSTYFIRTVNSLEKNSNNNKNNKNDINNKSNSNNNNDNNNNDNKIQRQIQNTHNNQH